jgi:hypothetical protein
MRESRVSSALARSSASASSQGTFQTILKVPCAFWVTSENKIKELYTNVLAIKEDKTK